MVTFRKVLIALVLSLSFSVSARAQVTPGPSLAVLLNRANVFTVQQTVTVAGLAAVSSDGLTVQNTTASTGGVTVQYSPRMKWCGTAWNSVGTVSQVNCFIAEVQPITAGGTTSSNLVISSSVAGGAYSSIATWNSGGQFTNNGSIFVAGTSKGFGVGNIGIINNTPSVSSGFGGTPSVLSSNGSATFRVNVGTGGVATSGIIAMNATAGGGWNCQVTDMTTNIVTRMTASNGTTVTVTAASAWSANDTLVFMCWAY